MRRALLAAALAGAAFAAHAQANVVRLVVPFGAGAVQDTIARSISAELAQALGRSVIVENRAGAGGTVGTGAVAKSPADGQTLILAGASHTISASLYARLPYHPLKDFTPIVHIGTADYAFIVHAGVPAKRFMHPPYSFAANYYWPEERKPAAKGKAAPPVDKK